jgi:hypothetical protein
MDDPGPFGEKVVPVVLGRDRGDGDSVEVVPVLFDEATSQVGASGVDR